jgi:hypothetical protein
MQVAFRVQTDAAILGANIVLAGGADIYPAPPAPPRYHPKLTASFSPKGTKCNLRFASFCATQNDFRALVLRAYPKTHWNHDGLSFRAGQGGCSGGNTQGGLSPEQITPPDVKRHATRCGHGVFCPAAVFLAGGQDRCGY